MCIAIYSPMGNEVPNDQYLKNSFLYNDDGAGFAFNTDDGRVKICKGFMTYDSFKNTFDEYNNKYNFKDRGVLIHFRITTHGGTCKECCHPFPLISDEGAMHKLEYTSDYAVIHNGIISLTSTEAHKREKMSDTMVFVEKYLSRIASNKDWFENSENFELIYDLIDSKMAVLNGEGRIKSTAGFTMDDDGNYYSNTSYKTGRYSYYSAGWDYYDDWDGYPYHYGNEYNYYGSSKKKDSKTDSKLKTLYTPARLLKRNECVYMEDGEVIEFDSDMPVLVSMQGEVFVGSSDTDVSKYTIEDVDYYGDGEVLNFYTFTPVTRSADKCVIEKIPEDKMPV